MIEALEVERLYGSSVKGNWKEGSLAGTLKEEGPGNGYQSPWGPRWGICRGLVYQGLDKALETGIFLHRGTVQYHGATFNGKVERGLWKRIISLYGSSVKGGSFSRGSESCE